MIRHIVCWTFVEEFAGMTRAQLVDEAVAKLELCRDLPGIVEFELVRPQPGLEASFDLMLNCAFRDEAALGAYAVHPLHQSAGAFIAGVRKTRQAMDYDPAQV